MAAPPPFARKDKGVPGSDPIAAGPPGGFAKKGKKLKKSAPAQKALRQGGSRPPAFSRGGGR